MRTAIEALLTGPHHQRRRLPDHPGLAYDVWRPLNPGGEDSIEKKGEAELQRLWLEWVEKAVVPDDYPVAYRRWRASFKRDDSRALEGTLSSRMLLGHGNPSPTGVGLTLPHTWGVPMIPGTALKGLVASYVQAKYGPDGEEVHPLDSSHPEPERAMWQGVHWEGKQIKSGPGAAYRMLFGAPRAESDTTWLGDDPPELAETAEAWLERCLEQTQAEDEAEMTRSQQRAAWVVGERQGLVTFHDALLVPEASQRSRPFLVHDVLTVHQRTYYERHGGDADRSIWPNDCDAPNPVSFLTLRPGLRFLFPLGGADCWTKLAGKLLKAALSEWGIGGKTSAGYGRFDPTTFREVITPPDRSRSAELTEFITWAEAIKPKMKAGNPTQREVLAQLTAEWVPRLETLDAEERTLARQRIGGLIRSKRLKSLKGAVLARLGLEG